MRNPRSIAAPDREAAERYTQLVRDDLRQGGREPLPDLDRTDYLLMLGANPYESNGSPRTASIST